MDARAGFVNLEPRQAMEFPEALDDEYLTMGEMPH
jgi:hypothetical protein